MNSGIQIECFTENTFAENAYVISVKGHNGVWVIDPSFKPKILQICEYIRDQNKVAEAVLLTHGHADHIAGVDTVLEQWPQASLLVAREEAVMLTDADANLSAPFGFDFRVAAKPTGWLDPGTLLTLGTSRWTVLDTSGHSPGGRSFYCPEADAVITGDALFAGSIGRTDFPGSSADKLIGNIRNNLFTLPDETRIYSGHGPVTTVQKERRYNPFLAE